MCTYQQKVDFKQESNDRAKIGNEQRKTWIFLLKMLNKVICYVGYNRVKGGLYIVKKQ